jgi:Holliday junction DNA helicase RuvA
MIGYLIGNVLYSDSAKTILLTSSGIGYEIYTSSPKIPNKDIGLFISHIIREATQDLFGFETIEDKKFFEMLLNVNGIGPKSAFSLITHLGVDQIISAVLFENVDIIKSAPGIGKKSAEQIILSLKDKVSKLEIGLSVNDVKKSKLEKNSNSLAKLNASAVKDALEACQGLGFKDQDVLPLIQRQLQADANLKTEELLKNILKELR